MTMNLPKPTAETVQELHDKLITDWSPTIAENEVIRDLVHRRNKIEVLEDDPDRNIQPFEVHTSRAGGIIEHAAGLIMAMPSWSMEPTSPKTDDKESAEKTEITTAKVFQQQILRNDFWLSIAKDVLIYGRAYLKALPLPSVWTAQAGYPVRKTRQSPEDYLETVRKWKASDAKFPFVMQHIPTMSILSLLDAEDNPIATIEEKRVVAGILADKNGMNSSNIKGLMASGALKWFDEVSVVEYTDCNYVQYYLVNTSPEQAHVQLPITATPKGDYKLLKSWQHGLGKCPVVMFTGIKTEVRDYIDRYKSFLADAQESLEMYDLLISRKATMVGAYYLPSYELKLPESGVAQGGKSRPKFQVRLGGVTPTYSDELLQMLPYPQGLFDADTLISVMDDNIQKHTLEDVLYGRVQGSAPAFQVNLRINQAMLKLFPISQHLAQGITNVMDLFYRGVEQLGESVLIDGDEMTVQMAKSARGRMTASIEPKSPVDRAQDIGVANMYKEFGMSWDWIVEEVLRIQNPAMLRIEKMVADLEKLPPLQAKMIAKVLDEYDLLETENEFTDMSALRGALPPELGDILGGMMGMGNGPWPTGGAPSTIQGGRGLMTSKEQPVPGNPQAGTEIMK